MTQPQPCKHCGQPAAKGRRECRRCRDRKASGWQPEEIASIPPQRPNASSSPRIDAKLPLHERLAKLLHNSRQRWTLESLSDACDCGMSRIREALRKLEDEGRNVRVSDTVEIARDLEPTQEATVIDVGKLAGKRYVFGALADNHLCSKYARMEVLNALYDLYAAAGIRIVYQAGNMIDGEAPFNRFDLIVRPGLEAQAEYLTKHWPKRDGIVTEFLCGDDHEGFYVRQAGVNIVRYLQEAASSEGRHDMRFIGYMERDIIFRGRTTQSILRVMHGGGGSTYAHSYTSQKYAESIQGGTKPQLCLIGHFHKYNADCSRGITMIQVGSTQDQTPFLRKKRIESVIGGCTVWFDITEDGLMTNIGHTFHNFYDRQFYASSPWGYKWN